MPCDDASVICVIVIRSLSNFFCLILRLFAVRAVISEKKFVSFKCMAMKSSCKFGMGFLRPLAVSFLHFDLFVCLFV